MTFLHVNEIFGPVWQGEGPAAGERAVFLRLGGCNLDCGVGPGALWACDTPYSWDWDQYDRDTEVSRRTAQQVADDIAHRDAPLLVITGGEPLLQRNGIAALLPLLPDDMAVDIETNGTRPPLVDGSRIRRYVVSLKLSNSGVELSTRLDPPRIRQLEHTDKATWKFVVTTVEDVDEAAHVVDDFGLRDVWCMPAGTYAAEILGVARSVAERVTDQGFNLTMRQHVLLHENARGV